jgi:transaldolase
MRPIVGSYDSYCQGFEPVLSFSFSKVSPGNEMKFFIDSANIEEIKEANALGVLDGVTTNPSLVAKSGKSFDDVAKSICQVVKGPVNLEVVSLQWEEMVSEGKNLRRYGENVVVKIPMTEDGLKAVKKLSSEGIPTNVTLIFQPVQALLAAKAGATYVSPFVGRHDDIAQDGMVLAKDILDIYRAYGFPTQCLVASVRHPIHVLQAAKMGAHVVTLPLKVIQQLTKHPLTESGLKTFLEDWKKVKG